MQLVSTIHPSHIAYDALWAWHINGTSISLLPANRTTVRWLTVGVHHHHHHTVHPSTSRLLASLDSSVSIECVVYWNYIINVVNAHALFMRSFLPTPIYMYTHTYTCPCIQSTHTFTHTHTHAHTHVHTHTHMHAHVCTHTCTHTCAHTHMHTHSRTRVHTRTLTLSTHAHHAPHSTHYLHQVGGKPLQYFWAGVNVFIGQQLLTGK